jgi:hypothetical protein
MRGCAAHLVHDLLQASHPTAVAAVEQPVDVPLEVVLCSWTQQPKRIIIPSERLLQRCRPWWAAHRAFQAHFHEGRGALRIWDLGPKAVPHMSRCETTKCNTALEMRETS